MKLGRISVPTLDGDQARIVALTDDGTTVVDLAVAYARLLRSRGADADGALSRGSGAVPLEHVGRDRGG